MDHIGGLSKSIEKQKKKQTNSDTDKSWSMYIIGSQNLLHRALGLYKSKLRTLSKHSNQLNFNNIINDIVILILTIH